MITHQVQRTKHVFASQAAAGLAARAIIDSSGAAPGRITFSWIRTGSIYTGEPKGYAVQVLDRGRFLGWAAPMDHMVPHLPQGVIKQSA